MVFGILALALKNKTLGIIAIVSGACVTILWLIVGLSGDSYTMIGSLMLIAVTGIPDLTMGIIQVGKRKKEEELLSTKQLNSNDSQLSLAARINEIQVLKEKGALNEEEFQEAKKIILEQYKK